MNMTKCCVVGACCIAFTALADVQTYNLGKAKMHPKFLEASMKRNGGVVERADSFKGKIFIVDERAAADTSQLLVAAESFTKQSKYNVTVLAKSAGGEKCPKKRLAALGGQIGVFVVEDDVAPSLLVAPEDGWAVVNVKPLVAGVEKSRLAPLRIQKEVLRAIGFVCGGMSTQFPGSLAGSVVKPSDLDAYGDIQLPADVVQSFKHYLPRFGVTPYQHSTYRQAVQEGWAPAPTNKYQKAIWDKVHALPTEPIKIKPETKKVTE